MSAPGQLPQKTAQVDLGIYTMEAVLKSSYRFTGRAFVELKTVSECSVEVSIRPKQPGADAETLMAEFLNDLLDQRLRTIVAQETAATRDRIMAHALSQTGFLRPELETADPAHDPAKISAPPDRVRAPP